MKNKKNAKSILYLLLIFFIIICISVGYCTTDNIILEIEGSVSAEIPKILYIDSIEIDSSISSECSYSSYKSDGTLLQIFSLTLPKENVTDDTNATILVHVTNLSEFAYTFAGIKYLSAEDLIDFPSISIVNSNSNIKIDESSYENLIESVDGKNKNKMVIPIKFKYADISNITDNTLDISIKLNFNKLEKQVYNLKTGKDLYNVIGSHSNDATKIIFCTNSDLPENAIKLGDAGLENEQITAYWKDGTIYMSWMFENNTNLTNIIFGSNFVTSAVQGTKDNEGLAGMFSGCSNIKTLNLSNFDTSNVRTMFVMFSNCKNLEKIYVSDKFVTTGLSANLYSSDKLLFQNCLKLKGEQGTTFSSGNDGALYARIDGGEDNPGYFSRETEYIVTLHSNNGTFSNGETVKTYTGSNKINIALDEKPIKSDGLK